LDDDEEIIVRKVSTRKKMSIFWKLNTYLLLKCVHLLLQWRVFLWENDQHMTVWEGCLFLMRWWFQHFFVSNLAAKIVFNKNLLFSKRLQWVN